MLHQRENCSTASESDQPVNQISEWIRSVSRATGFLSCALADGTRCLIASKTWLLQRCHCVHNSQLGVRHAFNASTWPRPPRPQPAWKPFDSSAPFISTSIWSQICRWMQELMGSQASLVCNDGPPPWPWHTHTRARYLCISHTSNHSHSYPPRAIKT